jgi:hypothetical protein
LIVIQPLKMDVTANIPDMRLQHFIAELCVNRRLP